MTIPEPIPADTEVARIAKAERYFPQAVAQAGDGNGMDYAIGKGMGWADWSISFIRLVLVLAVGFVFSLGGLFWLTFHTFPRADFLTASGQWNAVCTGMYFVFPLAFISAWSLVVRVLPEKKA